VFRIPETSQFYITFEVWQRAEEARVVVAAVKEIDAE
jgi:hypothetical protein